jgi:putative spermidine/putrescine transport system substrate-binding protein
MTQNSSSSAWKAFKCLAVLMAAAIVMAACAPAATPTPTAVPTAVPPTAAPATLAPTAAAAGGMDALVAAAKAEGSLTVIALPHDWCNYGGMITGFKAKYGLTVNELTPDASSGDEVNAIKANQSNTGPQAPDVIDVGLSFGPQAKTDKLIQPYKVATWDTIPAEAKDADGYWYGDYYGVLAFMVNTDVQPKVPQDWSDLLAADYKGQVAR